MSDEFKTEDVSLDDFNIDDFNIDDLDTQKESIQQPETTSTESTKATTDNSLFDEGQNKPDELQLSDSSKKDDPSNNDVSVNEFIDDTSFFDDAETSKDTAAAKTSSPGTSEMANQYSFRQIGSVAKFVEPVSGENSIDVLVDMFDQQPDLEAIPIEEFDHVIGVMDRKTVAALTSSAWKRFIAKDIISYVKRVSTILYAQDYVEKTVDKVSKLNRDSGVVFFPVFRSKSFYGIISLDDFLARVAEIREQDLIKAQAVQVNLLPHPEDLVNLPFTTSIYNRMANAVGGDFYISHKLSDNQYILGVFDVSGKNIAASLLTITVGSFFAAMKHMLSQSCTHEQLTALLDDYLQEVVPMGSFITAAICYIDLQKQRVYIQNCGHTTIYVYTPDEKTPGNVQIAEINPDLPPMGMGAVKAAIESKKQKYTICLPIKKDMHIELYSDGFTDMQTPESERYEEARAVEFFQNLYNTPSNEVSKKIETTIVDWIQNAMQADDITIMDIRF